MLIFQEQYSNFEFTPLLTKVYSESVYASGMTERFFFPNVGGMAERFFFPWPWHDPVVAHWWTWSTFPLKLLEPWIVGGFLLPLPFWPVWHAPVVAHWFTVPTPPLKDWFPNCLAFLTGFPADQNKERKNVLESKYCDLVGW